MKKIFLVILCVNLFFSVAWGETSGDSNADSSESNTKSIESSADSKDSSVNPSDSKDLGANPSDSKAQDEGDSTTLDSLTIIKEAPKHHSTLSIRESYDKVLLNNDSLKASKSAVQKAQKLKSGAYMLFAPEIDIMGNYTFMEKTSLDIHIPPLSFMGQSINIPSMKMDLHKNHFAFGIINAVYPIYTGGKRLSALKMAKLNIQDSELLMQLNKINLFEKLVKSYFGVKLSYDVHKTLKDGELGALAHLNNAKKLQENGQIAKIEFLGAKVEYDKAKNKTHEAKDALDIALLAFKTILQDENLTNSVELNESGEIMNLSLTSELVTALDAELKPLQYYKDTAISAYPALKSLEVKKLQTKELTEIEFGNFLPTVGLYGGYVLKANNTMLNRAIPSWFVGITAKMSLISTSGRIFKYQASKIAQNEVDYLHRQAKSDILLLIETTYKEVLSAKESYKNHSSTIELATENLNLQEKAFINGMASTVQVSDARNQLSLAKIDAQNSQYRYAIALAKLYAITNDMESFWTFYEKQNQ